MKKKKITVEVTKPGCTLKWTFSDGYSCFTDERTTAMRWHNKWVKDNARRNQLPTPEEVSIAKEETGRERILLGLCPECADVLVKMEGCNRCMSCGWTACDN